MFLNTPIDEPNDDIGSPINPVFGQHRIPESAQGRVVRSYEATVGKIDKALMFLIKIRN